MQYASPTSGNCHVYFEVRKIKLISGVVRSCSKPYLEALASKGSAGFQESLDRASSLKSLATLGSIGQAQANVAMETGRKVFSLFCLGFLAISYLCVTAAIGFPGCLDHLLHPEHAPKLKAGQQFWDANAFTNIFRIEAYVEPLCARADQLGDPEEAPESCMSIQATDVVRNFAEAHQCSEFCRERLGPGKAAPLPALATGMVPCSLKGNSSQAFAFNETGREQLKLKLLNTCFKSRFSELTRSIMDSWWCPWALAAFYRTLGLLFAFYRYRHSSPPPPPTA